MVEVEAEPRGAELALVAACLAGDVTALAEFERSFSDCLQLGAARVRSDPEFVAEVVQSLRVELFTGAEPRAGSFTARGPLAAWLKVVATRAALDKLRSDRRWQLRSREAPAPAAGSSTGIEGRIDRQRHGEHFTSALRAALDSLDARDRNLLRLRYVSGLSIDGIGLAYSVHRATVARWIASAVEHVGRALREQIEHEGRAHSPSELEGALRALDSQLAGAIASFLGATDPHAEIER